MGNEGLFSFCFLSFGPTVRHSWILLCGAVSVPGTNVVLFGAGHRNFMKSMKSRSAVAGSHALVLVPGLVLGEERQHIRLLHTPLFLILPVLSTASC